MAAYARGRESRVAAGDAEKEKVDNSYVSRMVKLTLLAADIVAAILADCLPGHLAVRSGGGCAGGVARTEKQIAD